MSNQKIKSTFTVGVTIICIAIGCQKQSNKKNLPTSGTVATAQPITEPEPYKLMDNASEYELIKENYSYYKKYSTSSSTKKSDLKFIKEFGVAYKQASQAHDNEISSQNAKIESQLSTYTDADIRRIMKTKLEKEQPKIVTPDINNRMYLEDSIKQFETRLTKFRSEYSNHFFAVATYEFYLPDQQVAIFNLGKLNNPDFDKKLYSFGERTPTPSPKTLNYFKSNIIDYDGGANSVKNDYFELTSLFPDYYSSGSDSVVDHGKVRRFTSQSMVIKIDLKDMNNAFRLVDEIWKSKIDETTKNEEAAVRAGMAARGLSIERMSDQRCHALTFARKNSIMLVAKGDPFEMVITECHLIVTGSNVSIIKYL